MHPLLCFAFLSGSSDKPFVYFSKGNRLLAKGLITVCIVSLAFFLIPTNGRKTQEQFSILHCALGKNAGWLDLGTFEVIKTQNPKHGVIL